MNIVFLDKSTVGEIPGIDRFRDFGNLTCYDITPADKTIERVAEADVIITNKVIIDQKVMDQAHRLKLVCIAATGMNNVDLQYARQKNIQVKNVAGYSTNSVVQSTFGMLFYLMGHLRYYDDYVRSGQYSESPIFTHHGKTFRELSGKTFGIIGLGTIGKKVAGIADTFGAKVIYYSTSGNNNDPGYKRENLDILLGSSDVVSIHAPLNEKTQNLINYGQLKKMKPTAYLINAGRGGIVNEPDLARALDEKIISGAALDVLEKEPIRADNPLLKVRDKERLLILPHIAWASLESRTLLVDKIYENIASLPG